MRNSDRLLPVVPIELLLLLRGRSMAPELRHQRPMWRLQILLVVVHRLHLLPQTFSNHRRGQVVIRSLLRVSPIQPFQKDAGSFGCG